MEFRLLGPLEVLGDDGRPLALGGPRPRALLTLLLLHPNEAVSIDRLIDGIWGETPPPTAQNALQVHVSALRGVLGPNRIETRPPGYLLHLEDGELDVRRFERLVEEGRPHEALALWRGSALADLAYEPFVQSAASRLEDARLAALEARVAADLDDGRHEVVAAELEALVQQHPHRERLRAQQMLALYRSGRQADALAAYREARTALDELGLEPSAELRSLEGRILRQEPDLEPPPVTTAPSSRALPVSGGALIGRALEHASVNGLLGRDDTRLVTLTGPGGTGKTRLALAVAESMVADGAPCVVFVDLSPILDPSLVLPTVLHALAESEDPGGDPVPAIGAALGETPSLLVLDNLEQVVDAASDVAAVLDATPTLKVLATSRAPLRIAHEHEYRVPPLAVPEEVADPAELSRNPSVALYVERARGALPGFELTAANADAIARICRALDGLPLALELAAARVRSLGPGGTAARVGERLSLLSRGARDVPERQRSLRATIDWSAQLLEPEARQVFAAMAAFTGGATLEALEAAVGDPAADVPGAVDDLLDAALVTHAADDAGAPRFGMLETVREYAAEILGSSGDERAVRDRHLAWFLRFAEGEGVYWRRSTNAAWLARVAADHENYRAALAHARVTGDTERELRLANALRYFWRVRGYIEEGRRRLEEAVALSADVEPALRGRTLGEAGVMAFAAGDYRRSRELWSEALPLLERLGEPREIARALGELGACNGAEGDLRAAVPLYEASLEKLGETDDEHGVGVMLGNLAAAYEGLGDTSKARDASLEALRLQERIGDDDGVAISNLNMASLEASIGHLDAASGHLGASLDASQRLGYREGMMYALGIGAQIAVERGEIEQAGLLSGAFEEQFRAVGTPQAEEAERARRVRERVAEHRESVVLLERGRRLTLDEAVALTRRVVGASPSDER